MSSSVPRASGSINVKFGVELELKINAIAQRAGLHRNDWLRKLVQEAMDADAEGRPIFQKVEGPRIDASLHELVADVRGVLIEWDRISREHDRRERKFVEFWNGGEEAMQVAYDRLNQRINQMHQESYNPFVEKLRALRQEMAGVRETCAGTIETSLAPVATRLEQIEQLARKPRVIRNLTRNFNFGKDWPLSNRGFVVFMSIGFSLGVLFTLITPMFFDSTAVGMASKLITSSERMCGVIEHFYATHDCTIPKSVSDSGKES